MTVLRTDCMGGVCSVAGLGGLGGPAEQARGGVRLTLGRPSAAGHVDAFLMALPAAVERAQRAQVATSPLSTTASTTAKTH